MGAQVVHPVGVPGNRQVDAVILGIIRRQVAILPSKGFGQVQEMCIRDRCRAAARQRSVLAGKPVVLGGQGLAMLLQCSVFLFGLAGPVSYTHL